jgi:hypothetical protein
MKYPVFIITGLTSRRGRRKEGKRRGGERIRVGGASWSHATGEFGKGIAREELGKLNVVFEVEPFVFEKATM